MYKTSDATCSTSDWVSLNFDSVPTAVLQKLFGDSPEGLVRVQAEKPCTKCAGAGEIDGLIQNPLTLEAEHGTDVCGHCDGSGTEPQADDDSELYGWPAAHGWVWTCEDRPEIREALLESGFIVYTDESRECYFSDVLIVGIDGGGYSFHGQHWIPLRTRLAKHAASSFNETIRPDIRALLRAEANREGEGRSLETILALPIDPCPICGEDRNHVSQPSTGHRC